jgi:hypothetical protein
MRSTLTLPAYLVFLVLLVSPETSTAQGLPTFAPLNPVASSRSGVYFQPLNDRAGKGWSTQLAVDYASLIEYNQLDNADYVLDSEILRVTFGALRNLGSRTFVQLSGSVGGSYSGFLDGFLDWYHGALGIRVSEREQRPQDRFGYNIRLPDGRSISHSSNAMFLGDLSVALGFRHVQGVQSVVSLTLPTATGPAGYGKGVPSVALLNTLRSAVSPRLLFEGSVGAGVTPSHGPLSSFQRTTFLALSSGVRHRLWDNQALYANLFYHSPYYHGTSLPALDRRELSLDFGWILTTRAGAEWRMGLTEDLEPGGPGIDLVFRVGRSF